MSDLFPFGYPGPTAGYLGIYVVTLAIHVVFMNYVLGGSAVLAFHGVARLVSRSSRPPSPFVPVMRDWMPVAVSMAITAGVAPLLFVQILYQEHFYSANLLLFYRWMAILPVLIVGFYLLYLVRTEWLARRGELARAAVAVGAFACFAFTAYSWTENHLLSVRPREWPGFYASGALFYTSPDVAPRLALWFLGSFPTLAAILAWQTRHSEGPAAARRLSALGLGSIVAALAGGALHFVTLEEPLRAQYFGSAAGPYFYGASAGLALQALGWLMLWRTRRLSSPWLWLPTIGCATTILGMAVVREVLRLSTIDVERLHSIHARAATLGGLPVFLVFFVANAALIAWCFVLVRRGRRPA